MHRPRLLAAGETMAMIAPVVAEPFETAVAFRVEAGGAESNVAVHAAALGVSARWFSRLGEDAIGRRVVRQLKGRGVDVRDVVLDPARPTGVYVKDPGRAVGYYRRGSAASHLSPNDALRLDLAWADVLHLSGITPALSASAARFVDHAILRARAAGVAVSFDVNHRPALWGWSEAARALAPLARRADVVFVGQDEAERLWGVRTPEEVRALFPDVPELVVKDADVGATVFSRDGQVFEASRAVEVVEPVGAGDAFAGGYLAARLSHAPLAERLRAGHERAAATLATTSDFPDREKDTA
nr:sugar kinase [Microbacterium sp. MF43]